MLPEREPYPSIDRATVVGDVKHVGVDRPGEVAFWWTDPTLLHGEEVGEIGLNETLEHAHRGLFAKVVDDNVLAHALTDVAAPKDHQVRVGSAGRGFGPGNEGC